MDLLPYPDELKPKHKITPETAKILMKVLPQINPKLVGFIAEVISEAVEITKGSNK